MTHIDDADDLSDALAGDYPIDDFLNQEREDWSTLTIIDADWHARKARQAQRRIDEQTATAEIMRARIDEWLTRRLARDEAARDRHLRALHAYHAHRLEIDPAERTVDLPTGGRLRSQAGKLSVAITDETAFMEWALVELPDAIVTKTSVDKTKIAKAGSGKAGQESEPGEYPAVTAAGEVIPGVAIVRGDRRFYVDLPEDLEADTPTAAEDGAA